MALLQIWGSIVSVFGEKEREELQYNIYAHSRTCSHCFDQEAFSHDCTCVLSCRYVYVALFWADLVGHFFPSLLFHESIQITCTRYIMNIIRVKERLRLRSDLQLVGHRFVLLLSWFIVEVPFCHESL